MSHGHRGCKRKYRSREPRQGREPGVEFTLWVGEPAGSPKSITDNPPVFGSQEAFMRAQFNELSAALRAQEVLLRAQQDLQEQADALRSTADRLRAAHLSR